MSSKEAVLSSEKALDDYFSALLDEEQELELIVEEDEHAADWSGVPYEPELQIKYSEPESYSYAETELKEFEAPNLEDVERLLSQLESTNVVDDWASTIFWRKTPRPSLSFSKKPVRLSKTSLSSKKNRSPSWKRKSKIGQ